MSGIPEDFENDKEQKDMLEKLFDKMNEIKSHGAEKFDQETITFYDKLDKEKEQLFYGNGAFSC